jgi:serine/threonine protein phosphatase 1
MKNRTLVIGDIHGAYRALEQVVKRAEVRQGDTLIFLGDYVDGWSQSFEVIAYLMELNQQYSCIFIKGNHDAWCNEWLQTQKQDDYWLANGGEATVKSYAQADKKTLQQHLDFFSHMHNYHIDKNNNLFIHAGFTSMHGPHKEMYETTYRWDRTLWELAIIVDDRVEKDSLIYPKRLKLFEEIFIGHTQTLKYDVYTPMRAVNVWNIDTGAAYHGKLTVMDIATKGFWQSDAVKDLYPGERGRN